MECKTSEGQPAALDGGADLASSAMQITKHVHSEAHNAQRKLEVRRSALALRCADVATARSGRFVSFGKRCKISSKRGVHSALRMRAYRACEGLQTCGKGLREAADQALSPNL
eukprot:2342677-Pleurochrysis_carterae.AAC.4